eukprot:10597569-Lingulodinium_polyedra.AAC.1
MLPVQSSSQSCYKVRRSQGAWQHCVFAVTVPHAAARATMLERCCIACVCSRCGNTITCVM